MADEALSDIVQAERYVEPKMRQSLAGVTPLYAAPNTKAPQVSQIRYGEFVDVFEFRDDGYAWVQNRSDRYVGYVPPGYVFGEQIADLSHRLFVLRSPVYSEPSHKSRMIDELTLGSHVSVGGREGDFCRLSSGGYVFAGHVAPTSQTMITDYVFTAGRLLHMPYLWGGRTPRGIDCSGLVQLSLEMAEIDCPRDSDQQREAFGKPLDRHWRDTGFERGDIVFFPGHVGIMTGPVHMIHASGHHMLVTAEPLADAVLNRGLEIVAVGRP